MAQLDSEVKTYEAMLGQMTDQASEVRGAGGGIRTALLRTALYVLPECTAMCGLSCLYCPACTALHVLPCLYCHDCTALHVLPPLPLPHLPRSWGAMAAAAAILSTLPPPHLPLPPLFQVIPEAIAQGAVAAVKGWFDPTSSP